MGTWTTFATQPIYDMELANELEKNLIDFKEKRGKIWFNFQKIYHGEGCVYFTGISKETSEGFYNWFYIDPWSLKRINDEPIIVAYSTDEQSAGFYPTNLNKKINK